VVLKSSEEAPPRELTRFAYSVAETAAHIGVSKKTVYELLNRGELRAVRMGGRTLIRREELLRFLDGLPAWQSAAS
jgi:excisionase family DNA binding protein